MQCKNVITVVRIALLAYCMSSSLIAIAQRTMPDTKSSLRHSPTAKTQGLSPTLSDPGGVRDFEAKVVMESTGFQLARRNPTPLEQELTARLKSGNYVSDTAIMAVVGAWSVYESPGLNYAGHKDAQGHLFPNTKRLINVLLSYTYGRPALEAQLHQSLGSVAILDHDSTTAAQEYGKALAIQKPYHEDMWLRYNTSCVEMGDLLLKSGKVAEAIDMYGNVLQDESYYLLDDDAKEHALHDVSIQAGMGLINCRKGNLKMLQRTFFADDISPILNPIRDRAIQEAEQSTGASIPPLSQSK